MAKEQKTYTKEFKVEAVRLMQALGLCAKPHKRRKPRTTSCDPTASFAPNRLNRDFTAARPNTKFGKGVTEKGHEFFSYGTSPVPYFIRKPSGGGGPFA